MSYTLLAGFYADPEPARAREFIACLERNLANEHIAAVHLFVEEALGGRVPHDLGLPAHPKLRLLSHGRRTTYSELFEHANARLAGQRVIVANADICFDHTLARLDSVPLAGRMACLSRWDLLDDGSLRFFDHPSSQDAWIFEAPLPPLACDFHLGLLGCDNRLAWEARAAGLGLFNPGRSVRACHLHRSGVRRYTEQQRLGGPVLSVEATDLHAPWLAFVVPCRGRLAALRATLETLVGQRSAATWMVDHGCPQHAGDWVRALHPNVNVVAVGPRAFWHAAEAFNLGAQAADDDALLCFVEAGTTVPRDFAPRLLEQLPPGTFAAGETALACRKADFLRAGGFDPSLLDPGDDFADLAERLRLGCLAAQAWPVPPQRLAEPAPAPASAWGDAATGAAIQAGYRRIKSTLLEETGGQLPLREWLRQTVLGVARHHLRVRGQGPGLPVAAARFGETMGYRLARLEAGVSSHVNLAQPLVSIPPALVGLVFTQVVAWQAGPVAVEFTMPGKLYVLVATDWYGHQPASDWLATAGFREPLPPLQTAAGTAFEVWSLVGEAGEQVVIPTQVMLAARELSRRG
jgi:hypothetical protein